MKSNKKVFGGREKKAVFLFKQPGQGGTVLGTKDTRIGNKANTDFFLS